MQHLHLGHIPRRQGQRTGLLSAVMFFLLVVQTRTLPWLDTNQSMVESNRLRHTLLGGPLVPFQCLPTIFECTYPSPMPIPESHLRTFFPTMRGEGVV